MHAPLGHMQINVHGTNLPFYRDLFAYVGWKTLYDAPEMLGVEDANAISLWFDAHVKPVRNDYDGPGLNHLALRAPDQAAVDAAAALLEKRGISLLFDTPRHRPEFSLSATDTYYQIMFESPDCILFEIVYIGPKQA